MIEAHTTDAWTRVVDRSTAAFSVAVALGGFAAPLFLWLAGVSIALAAARPVLRSGGQAAQADMICRRGLEIFILAFLFRLQAFSCLGCVSRSGRGPAAPALPQPTGAHAPHHPITRSIPPVRSAATS